MQTRQTPIDQVFKKRKRPATDELSSFSTLSVPKKLLYNDDHTFPPDFEEARSNEKEIEKPQENPIEREGDLCTPTTSPTSQALLRKKLNIGEFKKIIRRSKRYSHLKEKLEKFNANASKLKDIAESLNEISTPEFGICGSPVRRQNLKPRRLFWTDPCSYPNKEESICSSNESPIKVCFEKYHYLLTSREEPLILPHKYLVLKEIFRAIDVITKIKGKRGRITFEELQKEVQKMLKRNFTKQHLSQVKTVYPESYEYTQEYLKDANSGAQKFQLVVKRSNRTTVNSVQLTEPSNKERLQIFHDRLLQRTKVHHQKFLKKLNPPIILDINQIRTWHLEFKLENIPDIELTPIPEPPGTPTHVSAKDVLSKTHKMISINDHTDKTVILVENETSPTTPKLSTPITPSNPIPALQKALRGIPKSILEKIRAKQAAKIAEKIMLTPAKAEEAVMLSRLPELARIMRNVFVNEKKGILPVETVISKMSYSFKEKLDRSEFMQHMKLISKHVPGWMNFCFVHNDHYVRLSKDADMTRVLGKLKNLANHSGYVE